MKNRFIESFQEIFFRIKEPETYNLIQNIKSHNLTYLDNPALFDLVQAINLTIDVPGIMVEAGTALGGSAILIASVKPPKKELFLFDTFTQIPPPSNQDGRDVVERYKKIINGEAEGIGGDVYYGYNQNLYDQVKENFSIFGIDLIENHTHLIKGLFQETLIINQPVAFAHIDSDWYESVKFCLNQIMPNLQVNGRVVIDDYDHWSGCKLAVDEFLHSDNNIKKYKQLHKSRLHLQRVF
ncbi:MAG TPA: asparagine synthase [Chloroflexi bacterium]|jgi:asparagine synthase (glutamine-hydrolysing)|nr:asparagine synthase [Chloroflexota bacterium]